MTIKIIDDINEIFKYIVEAVRSNRPIPPSQYLDMSTELNYLKQELSRQLIDAKIKVAELKAKSMLAGDSSSKAKVLAEASPEFKECLLLEEEKARLEEQIMINKKYVILERSEYQ
jgi:hypothetical protein